MAELTNILFSSCIPRHRGVFPIPQSFAAQREFIAPALVGIDVPIIIGLVFGVAGVIGLLSGVLATGIALAITISNAGGAWDNAKKHIEESEHGGKGSEAHIAAVGGDTVGDPFKDTAGPAPNIFIKLMAIVSVVFVGLTVLFANGQGLICLIVSR